MDRLSLIKKIRGHGWTVDTVPGDVFLIRVTGVVNVSEVMCRLPVFCFADHSQCLDSIYDVVGQAMVGGGYYGTC